jgi:hypothetical protein
MSSQIIECAHVAAPNPSPNADWTNTLNKPLTLQPGDSIGVRQSILDLQLSGEYTNIQIKEDTQISITYGYFYTGDGVSITYKSPNYDLMELYVARNTVAGVGSNLFTNTIQFTLPAKNWSAPELAQFLSAQFSRVPQGITNITSFNEQANQILTPATNNYRIDCKTFTIPSSEFGFNSVQSQFPITDEIGVFYTGQQMLVYWRYEDSKYQSNTVTCTSVDTATGTFNFTPVIESPLDDSVKIFGVYIYLKTPVEIVFYNQNKTTPVPGTQPDAFTCDTARYMGTNEFSIEYDVNGSGKFQISIMHLSPYPSDTDADSCINFIQTAGEAELFIEDVRSGVFFTKLEPISFWQDILGFDLSTLIVQDGDNGALKTPLQRGVNITSNYVGLDSIIGATRALATIPTAVYNYKTTITNPIIAPQSFNSPDNGYLLVEIKAIPTQYDCDDRTMSGIVQIASNNWDSSGFVTVYSDSSIVFVNSSNEAMSISAISIRILDPANKLPHTLMGPKSTIFLEKVTNSQPIIQQPVV